MILACIVGLPGCATIITDDHQSIVVKTDPAGATCQIRQGGTVLGTIPQTPGTVYVGKSRHDIAIDCARYGYYPGAAVLQPSFQDWTFGNLLYGGEVGLLVDASSGAISEYPRAVTVFLNRLPRRGESAEETDRLARMEASRQRALAEGGW
jgi:hypothetical protein